MRQILNKRKCREFSQLNASFDPQTGILHCEQIRYVVRSVVKIIDRHRTLVLYFYPIDRVLAGVISPQYVLFQTKQDFITLEFCDHGTTRWRKCHADSLNGGYAFLNKCAFYCAKDEEIVKKYCNGVDKRGFTALERLQQNIQERKRCERRNKRLQAIVRRMQCVPPIPRGLKGFIHDACLPQFIFYDYKRTNKPVEGFCTACRHTVMITGQRHMLEGVCPRCKHKITFRSRGRKRHLYERETAQVIQRVSANELVLRIFKAYDSYQGKDIPRSSLYESARVFVSWTDSGSCSADWYYNTYCSGEITPWAMGTRPNYSLFQESFEADACGHLYTKNLDVELKDSPWQYSQLKQFYLQDPKPLEIIPYLDTYIRYPSIEYLVKLRLTRLASWAVYSRSGYYNGQSPLLLNGSNIREVLGLSKEHLPLLQHINPGGSQMIMIRHMIHSGKIPNAEFMRWCTVNDVHDATRITNILKYMSYLKLMRYAQEQFGKYQRRSWNEQGHRFSSMNSLLSDYSDYITMCQGLNFDLSNEFVLFPKNLPEAHSKVNDLSDTEISAAYDKVIGSRYEALKARYGFVKSGFMIIPPRTSKEIVEEGQKLRHCVGTYVKRVALDKTTILFLRRVREPEKPFCTIEIVDNRVMQARIQQNGDPPANAKAFLSLWKSKVVEARLSDAA